jgi:hypothetical protein
MSTKMIANWVQSPSAGTRTPPRVMTADAFIALTKAILSLPPLLLRRWRRSAPRDRESRQQRKLVSLCMSLFQIRNQTVWLIVMLN